MDPEAAQQAHSPASAKSSSSEASTAVSVSSSAILNIPKVAMSSAPLSAATTASREVTPPGETDAEAEGIGEFDDGRSGKLTLTTLLQENLVEPGAGVMSIDYLGQTFKADLLAVGKIRSVETGLIFNNPSAWAIYCKKIVNPAKKSGCGWASVKYKGRKMDYYKTIWQKRKAQREAEQQQSLGDSTVLREGNPRVERSSAAVQGLAALQQNVTNLTALKHNQLGLKHPGASFQHSMDALVDLETFSSQGKVQPFTVSISSSALLLLDLHCHLTATEAPVCGYLAGQWDMNSHNLAITHAFPCLVAPKEVVACSNGNGSHSNANNNTDDGYEDGDDDDDDDDSKEDDDESEEISAAARCEYEIYSTISSKQLSLIGWYRSSQTRALPTLRDVDAQLDHQIKMLGSNDSSYAPCVGLISRPYSPDATEAEFSIFWVVPPPENSPYEVGRPMKMQYTKVTDPCLSQETLDQIKKTIQFYKSKDLLGTFHAEPCPLPGGMAYITRMGLSLISKFPRDQDERLWRFIRVQVLGLERHSALDDPLMASPPAPAVDPSANGVHCDEEEIDDDEENALAALRRRRSVESHDSASSVTVSLISSTPATAGDRAATSDLLISTLLQNQRPLSEQKEQTQDHPGEKVATASTQAEKGGQHQGHVQDEYSDED